MIVFLVVIVAVLFSSCSEKKTIQDFDDSFLNVRKIVSSDCLEQELILGRPYLIHYADSSIIIYDDLTDSIFTLVDLKKDNSVYHFGRKGEGKDEFLQVFSFCKLYADSLIGVYDVFRRNLIQVNLCQVKKGVIEFPVLTKDSLMSINVYPTKYNTYLGLGFYENNMFSLTGDKIGNKYFFEYPYRDSREQSIKNRLRGMAYQGTLCSNHSLDKFVFAVNSAPIFFIYSIRESEIEETYKYIGGYPEYRTEENGEMRSAPMSADNILSFIKVYGTEKYIYILYSGNSFKEAGIKAFNGNIIYQMTWKGEPVCKFELDFPVMNFCVSDADDNIYALADKGEIELVRYSLNK